MDSYTGGIASPRIPSLIAAGGLSALFQPIVHLDSGSIVGYEALTRGPRGSALEMPTALFTVARAEGTGGELDRACREAALAAAVAGGLEEDDLLFLNVEPSTLDRGGALDRFGEENLHRVSVVVELTERSLTTRPAEVLSAVTWLRHRGCRIALDDVGIDPRSVALMPFVSPDLIKLDMRLVQDRIDPQIAARTLNAIGAEAERSGATLVAEGIETEQHLERARSLGAILGQGWLFGKPGPLDPPERRGAPIVFPKTDPDTSARTTPFERLTARRPPRRGRHELLLSLSRQLEDEVAALRGEAILVSNFQASQFMTPLTLARYEELATEAALVAALGPGMSIEPGRGIRGADIPIDDDLHDEWDVTVVGPHFAAAFAAREIGDPTESGEREFEYLLTYDRNTAIDAAASLLRRVLRSD
jgi:EAL domain-containing protein (putative c-di-GMP-specific phosphodiesterase class I)